VSGTDLWVQVQDPIEAAYDSEPEPDLAIGPHEPFGAQLLRVPPLVIEVSVSTHWLDRGRKAALYASAESPTIGWWTFPDGPWRCALSRGPAATSVARRMGRESVFPPRLRGLATST
jgi:hypothetical protein